MKKIKFVDFNKALVDKVAELDIESIHGDYFLEAYKTPFAVLMTASNPFFTFGGGLDYHFSEHFPGPCEYKRINEGANERILNICFTITVDSNLVATKETIKSALKFAIENTADNETLLISGVGTGIGRLSSDDFVSVLKELI